MIEMLDVFPAYAGMSPDTDENEPVVEGFPRLRGDEPGAIAMTWQATEFSPPTRG